MTYSFKTSLALLIILFNSLNLSAQKSWKEIKSEEDLYQSYPDLVETMFQQLNLNYPGLEEVRQAVEARDYVEASEALLEYYKTSPARQYYQRELPKISKQTDALADTILNNVFVIQNVRGQVPYGEDGHRDWYYKGPNQDEEWAWLSNRHSQISQVLNAYFETGNPKYLEYIDLFLRDFIIKSMPYPAQKGTESIWRGLEVAARAKVWTRLFYSLSESEYLSPATRLLILSSLPDHAHYNRHFHSQNNWLTMEISALATVAAYFPEYKASEEWLTYAVEQMTSSMKDQVYPDGVQNELTSHYHNVSLVNFELFQQICEVADKPLPKDYKSTMEAMYSYIAHAVRPSGMRVLNNDGDRGSDKELILKGAELYHHPDWEYIVTNGEQGAQPKDGPSYFFPWAGQFISRSGFDKNAHWSFFDLGPWGSGHQHNDKLHLSVSAYGRDLLVDAGRFAYRGEVAQKFRPYARGSQGHNLVLIDEKGQADGPTHAQKPLTEKHYKITDQYDYASNSFESFEDVKGVAKQIRSVLYVRGAFWVVVDRIETDRARDIKTLWHWHPENEVLKDGKIVKTNNEFGNLSVIPVSKQQFNIQMKKGQESPEIQGWYSSEYNIYEPNVASVYSAKIEKSTNFIWLLYPSENVAANIISQIIEENEKEVKIEVSSGDKKWLLSVPFMDSQNVDVVVEE